MHSTSNNNHSKTKPSLFISGDITEDVLMRILPFIHGNKNKGVQIFICSQGGDSRVGLEIYKLFQAHGKVTCISIGYCCSIATIIMLGAQKKLATPDCEFLIHHGLTSYHGRTEAKLSAELNLTIDSIYLKHLKLDQDALDVYNDSERPFLFAEAKELGLIDGEYKL